METPKIEDLNKITIGDQEFQKVGEMKSEPTGLEHAPKNYDLYQDTQDHALMGRLPEGHPSKELFDETKRREAEKISESVEIDLTKLSHEELCDLVLRNRENIYVEIENIKFYDKTWETPKPKVDNRDIQFFLRNKNYVEAPATLLEAGLLNLIKQTRGFTQEIFVGIGEFDEDYYLALNSGSISENSGVQVFGKNKIRITSTKRTKDVQYPISRLQITLSFLKTPEGYKELMEKKEVSE